MEKKYERKGTYNNKGMKQEKKPTEDKNDDEIGRINYDTDDCDDDGAAAADDYDYDNDDQQKTTATTTSTTAERQW